jgi:hypothetical protein
MERKTERTLMEDQSIYNTDGRPEHIHVHVTGVGTTAINRFHLNSAFKEKKG